MLSAFKMQQYKIITTMNQICRPFVFFCVHANIISLHRQWWRFNVAKIFKIRRKPIDKTNTVDVLRNYVWRCILLSALSGRVFLPNKYIALNILLLRYDEVDYNQTLNGIHAKQQKFKIHQISHTLNIVYVRLQYTN